MSATIASRDTVQAGLHAVSIAPVEMLDLPPYEPCGRCHGRRTIDVSTTSWAVCPTCQGTGTRQEMTTSAL